MRQKHLLSKMLLLVAVMLTGAGTAWADTTYKLTQVTSVEAGGLYVFEQKGYVMNNTVSSSALQTTNSYNSTGLSGTEEYVWKLEAATGGFYLKNVSLSSSQYLNNASSTNVSFGSQSSIWTIDFTNDVALISNKSNSNRFLGYTSPTSYAYKAYATSNLSGSSYPHAITVYKLEEEGNLTNSDLALDDAPVELSFDLYNNSSAQTISYTTSSKGAVTVSSSDYINAVVNESAKTITVTPTAVTPSAQTITVSQAADDAYRAGTVTFTVTIDDSTPIPTHTVTFSVNGTTTTQDFEEGAAITFPENPADVEEKTFMGWTETAITGVTDDAPTFVTSATMGTEALTFYAVFAEKTPGTQATVTDVLTSGTTGITVTNSYRDWTGKTVTSDAVYAGNSAVAASTSAIQMRSNSNSGIISTASGGTLKSVTVTWSGTEERTLDIYGSNTAYTETSDLYGKKQGTKLGSIANKTSTSLTVSGDYKYVGIRSNNGALYLKDISIEWTTGTPDTYSAYCTSVAPDTREEAGISFDDATLTKEIVDNYTGQVLNNPNNVTPITWTSSNKSVATVEGGTVTVLAVGETTISAAFAGDENYKKATVSYTLTIQDSRVEPGFSFSASTADALLGEAFDAPTFSNPNNVAVTFESTEPTVATIDENGAVTILAAGTTTIKATSETNHDYFAGEASYTLTVTDPNAPGTENNPYTVAEAIAYINTLGTSTSENDVYVSGIISQVDNYNSTYKAITYWISDDGTTTGQMEVYSGKGLDNADFSAKDDLAVGDIVTVKGKVKMYNTTPEFDKNNYLVSFVRPADTTPSISVNPATVDVEAGEDDGTLALAYANLTISDKDDFEIQYYDGEGEELSQAPEWIDVEVAEQDPQIGEGYVVSYVIGANDGEARTAYFKVYAMDDETNLVYSNLVTINQAEYVAPFEPVTYTLATTITSGKHYIITNGEDKAMGLQNNNNRASVDVDIENDVATVSSADVYEFVIYGPDANGFYTIYDEKSSGYLFAASNSSNHLKNKAELDDNGKWTITFGDDNAATVKAQGSNTHNQMRYNSGSDIFSCYGSGQNAIFLYEKDGEATPTETVTITDAKYATYCSENALDFSNTGLTAYIAKVAENTVTFEPVTKVPAYTGVLLKAENAGDVTVNATSSVDDVTGNAFIGVTKSTEINKPGIFVLMNGGQGVGFYKTTGSSFTLSTHTAYLPALANGNGTRSFIGLGEATGIDGIAAEKMINGAVYNLQGQRVTKAQKGLYIMDGKKVLVK